MTRRAIIPRTVPRPRRLLSPVPITHAGQLVALDAAQSHHARDVLRLTQGARVELFDAAGASGEATIATCDADALVVVHLKSVAPAKTQATANAIELTVAAAVPKGERADWMVEKL